MAPGMSSEIARVYLSSKRLSFGLYHPGALYPLRSPRQASKGTAQICWAAGLDGFYLILRLTRPSCAIVSISIGLSSELVPLARIPHSFRFNICFQEIRRLAKAAP